MIEAHNSELADSWPCTINSEHILVVLGPHIHRIQKLHTCSKAAGFCKAHLLLSVDGFGVWLSGGFEIETSVFSTYSTDICGPENGRGSFLPHDLSEVSQCVAGIADKA